MGNFPEKTTNNIESEKTSVENSISNTFNKLKKPLAILTIAAALGGGMVGCGNNSANAETNNGTQTEDGFDKEIKVPKEAREFVAEYGDRYDDTETAIGAYYAAEAYEKENNLKYFMLDQDFKEMYDKNLQGHWDMEAMGNEFDFNTNTDLLGFKLFKMSPEDDVKSEKTAIKSVDNLIGPMTELMINYLIKNPDSESQKIIQWEYIKMCSIAGFDPEHYDMKQTAEVKQHSDEFMQNIISIASSFSGNQNVEYIPSTSKTKEDATTIQLGGWTETEDEMKEEGYNYRAQGIAADMRFYVDTYDEKGNKTTELKKISMEFGTAIENQSQFLFFD